MKILSSLLLSFTLISPIFAETATKTLVPNFPAITANSYILQDFYSGKVLMAKNANERVELASLTKLMTAYIVFSRLRAGKINLTDKVKISEKAWRMFGSRMYLEVNTFVQLEQLLSGLIIQSGNDASVALAEFIAGSEEAFVMLMNEYALRLGLSNTHYTNSTGLSAEQHYSTVNDIARIAQFIIRDFPHYYHRWYKELSFTYNNITQTNRNLLLRRNRNVAKRKVDCTEGIGDWIADGMKTGYTEKAGYCLVGSATCGEMRLISVVLGTKSEKIRAQESEKMFNYGFRFFETYPVYQAHKLIDTEIVWYGSTNQLQLGLEKSLYVTVGTGQYKQLKATLYVDKNIMAPAAAGKVYGTLKIHLGHKIVAERPLIALNKVDKGPLWKRLIDSFVLVFY